MHPRQDRLAPGAGPGVRHRRRAKTAVLTGTRRSEAVGSFGYTAHPSGRVTPDPAWVAANIRTETVPLLGDVTCHRVMLPQLRAALTEVVEAGLAGSIHPDEYAGCYYPRFIAYDPAKGLSLHSWGIAVDLNTRGNQRGTVGEIDRQVVSIFKKWGFSWGGDWNYTDPMHFELASVIVRAGLNQRADGAPAAYSRLKEGGHGRPRPRMPAPSNDAGKYARLPDPIRAEDMITSSEASSPGGEGRLLARGRVDAAGDRRRLRLLTPAW